MEPIYDTIGLNYNATRRADPYITSRLLHLLDMKPNGHYLDIGCGTGNYTTALANLGLQFTGVEPSGKMLTEARNRDNKTNWLQGTAEQIPAEDNVFDGAIATLTIHHWTDLVMSFKEIHRTLKENATLVIFTATPEQMEGYWLNYYFPQMLRSSIIQMPALNEIENGLAKAGFNITSTEKYFINNDLQDLFLYAGKHRPAVYFNENVRKGISSFAALANAEEVKTGLLKLQSDLENGRFTSVKSEYENELGDYLFIIATKG